MFHGYIPAVVSPFKENSVDISVFEKYVTWLFASGMHAVVVCGSTGESIALTQKERNSLIRSAVGLCHNRENVIAGVIGSITDDCVQQAVEFEKCGAHALLCVCPYYVKPSQSGIYDHFRKIHDVTNIPIILYNNPGRTGVDLHLDTIRKLSSLERVVGLKEASNDITRFLLWRQYLKPEFSLLSGNDDSFFGALALGAHGVISVTANIVPDVCNSVYKAWLGRDIVKFERLRDKIKNIHNLLFSEPSPAPLKYALSLIGAINCDSVRSPLSSVSDQLKSKLKQELISLEVIK